MFTNCKTLFYKEWINKLLVRRHKKSIRTMIIFLNKNIAFKKYSRQKFKCSFKKAYRRFRLNKIKVYI